MTLVKIRKIKKEEMKEALELVWEVFLEYYQSYHIRLGLIYQYQNQNHYIPANM